MLDIFMLIFVNKENRHNFSLSLIYLIIVAFSRREAIFQVTRSTPYGARRRRSSSNFHNTRDERKYDFGHPPRVLDLRDKITSTIKSIEYPTLNLILWPPKSHTHMHFSATEMRLIITIVIMGPASHMSSPIPSRIHPQRRVNTLPFELIAQ